MTTRQFVASRATKSSGRLQIKKLAGKGKVRVKVQAQSSRGSLKTLRSFQIDKNDPKGQTWNISIPKLTLVCVSVAGKNALKSVGYSVKLSE